MTANENNDCESCETVLELFYLMFGLGLGRRAALAPRNAAGTRNTVREQSASEKSINGKDTWRETRDARDLAFALETAEDEEALAFANEIEASYYEELENPDFIFEQDEGVSVGSGIPAAGATYPPYVEYDTDWFPAAGARPTRGYHPALRIVVTRRPLTADEIQDEAIRIADYPGQEMGTPIDRELFMQLATRAHRALVERLGSEYDAAESQLFFYSATCDSGD